MVLIPGCPCCGCGPCAYAQVPTATMALEVHQSGAYDIPACAGQPHPNKRIIHSGFSTGNYTFPMVHTTDPDGRPYSYGDIGPMSTKSIGGVAEPDLYWRFAVSQVGLPSNITTVYTLFAYTDQWSFGIEYNCRVNGPPTTVTSQNVRDQIYEFAGNQAAGNSITYPRSYGYWYSLGGGEMEVAFGGRSFHDTYSVHFGECVDVFPITIRRQNAYTLVKTCNGVSYYSNANLSINGFGGMAFPRNIDSSNVLP